MKVFISWSGPRSRAIANRLRTWLPDVIQGVKPWVSATDIDAGARWGQHVQGELQESRFGIICLTRTNQTAPWVLFEAGALAKSIDEIFVCPYLIDLEPSELLAGPLVQFQAKRANEQETLDLVRTINRAQDNALPGDQLERTFAKWWPDLAAELARLPKDDGPAITPRPVSDMVEEILVAVRDLRRSIPEDAFPISDAMRAALAAGASDDITGAARNIRHLFAQVPDATLMSPEFWDHFIRGFRNSLGKRTPADLLSALDQTAPVKKPDT
jgi:TIR domain